MCCSPPSSGCGDAGVDLFFAWTQEMVDAEFSSKWGIESNQLATNSSTSLSTCHVLLGQFVLVVLLLWVIHPSFVMNNTDACNLHRMCWTKSAILAGVLVCLTYFLPTLTREFPLTR